MRALILSASSLMFVSGSALAYGETTEKPLPKPVPEATFEMPSTQELEAAIDELPDLNAILGDLLNLVKDEKLQNRMERSGDALAQRMEKSGALEPDENGIPDIKLTLKTLVGALSDEDVTGGWLDTVLSYSRSWKNTSPKRRPPATPNRFYNAAICYRLLVK